MTWRGLGGVLTLTAAVAVAQPITSRLPVGVPTLSRPFVSTGQLGEEVHISYADVTVTDVRPARYLGPPVSTELARMAGGVWVVVTTELSATTQPEQIYSAWLEDPDGRAYVNSKRSSCATTLRLPTGITTYAVYCFDVPADRLAGLHFRLARGDFRTDQTINDALADVDLDISEGDAETWSDTTKAYRSVDYSLEPVELQEITLTETGS